MRWPITSPSANDLIRDLETRVTKSNKKTASPNPLLKPWRIPYGAPPFSQIEPRHFREAFKVGIKQHRDEIDAIAGNEKPPTFANTIQALEKAGRQLSRTASVFFNLAATDATPEIHEIEREMASVLSKHSSAIYLNRKLFRRIDDLFQRAETLKLDDEQHRILERTHNWFVKAGANLKAADKKRVTEINARLSELATHYNQNVLRAEQSWHMALKSQEDLAGLPDDVRAAARQAAIDLGLKGEDAHAVTLARSSVESFLTFSDRRDLREKAFRAWVKRAETKGPDGNPELLSEAVALRGELARLMGYETYADYALSDTMAKTPRAVSELLMPVWEAARQRAAEECEALSAQANALGQNAPVAPWDWRYYAEKERKRLYDLDESEIRPYLQLESVIEAAFFVANRLFGLNFTPLPDADRYHPDVRVYEVTDNSGDHVALFYGDYFARPTKRSGAWMSRFRDQHKLDAKPARPIVVNVMNFVRGEGDRPTLLSFDDARTLFHEFGHGLHGMLSDVTFPSLSGTAVSRDFVELPSQLYEHWLSEPEILAQFARHYRTGKPMPKTLMKKLKASSKFNQGFATVEYTACALLDMELHAIRSDKPVRISNFEKKELSRIGMPEEIVMRHRLPHFMHIMGGYAAGYYSYMWSEVMDADAFEAFRETGDIFDPGIAGKLKTHIYSAGNRRDPEQAYLAFRGRPPEVEGLLKKRGFA